MMSICCVMRCAQSKNYSTRQRRNLLHKAAKMFACYQAYKMMELCSKKRRFWVRPIFREERRLAQGVSNNLIPEMSLLDTEKYINYFRMTPRMLEQLLLLVGPSIEKSNLLRQPISSRTRLELTIRYLSSGDSMVSLSFSFRIAHNTISKIISETCEEIWKALKDLVFVSHTEDKWMEIADGYENLWNFPNCVGAIDGKHVVMQVRQRCNYILLINILHVCAIYK